MALDLDQDYNINGHSFKKGKDVDTKRTVVDTDGKTKTVDYADAIKEMQKASETSKSYINTHHGAVPDPADPMEATAQTPTRPLAAPNVRAAVSVEPQVTTGEVIEVKDPSADGKGRSADESNKDVLEGAKESDAIVAGAQEEAPKK